MRNGYRRYPVRGALRDLLPPSILWRTSKLGFAPDYSRRYNAHGKSSGHFLKRFGPAIRARGGGYRQLKKALQPVAPTPRGFGIEGDIPKAFYLICFLRQFSAFR